MFRAVFLLVVLSGIASDAANIKRDEYDNDSTNQPCFVSDRWYIDGQRTGDPCDRCECHNGFNLCTSDPCNPVNAGGNDSCLVRGTRYRHLEKIPHWCYTCHCDNGYERCSQDCTFELPEVTHRCLVRGKIFEDGERTEDPCDRCVCDHGNDVCTRNRCIVGGVEV